MKIPPDMNFFNIKHFIPKHYRATSNLNFSRALEIILLEEINNQDIYKEIINNHNLMDVLSSYSHMFSFSTETISDFFKFLSMIYWPGKPRKHLNIYIGCPKSGKTTLQNMLHEIHSSSVHNPGSLLEESKSGNPDPQSIHLCGSYLCSIAELKEISSTKLKTLTGGDIIHRRPLFKNDFEQLTTLSHIFAACNDLPILRDADEAISDRLAPFKFDYKFIKSLGVSMEDNPLLLDSKCLVMTNSNINIENMAIELSNILYCQYALLRDKQGLLEPKIINKKSISSKLEILCRNNYIYSILHKSGITFLDSDNLHITVDEIQALVSPQLEIYNQKKGTKHTFHEFIDKMGIMFTDKKYQTASNKQKFRGLGIPTKNDDCNVETNKKNYCSIIKLKEGSSSNIIKLEEIKRYLIQKNIYNLEQINIILEDLKNIYKKFYNDELEIFSNLLIEVG